MKHKAMYKKGDWIHNPKRHLVAKVSGFDSNGVTVLLEGGSCPYGTDTAAIDECFKIEHTSQVEEEIYESFTTMYAALKTIANTYDWQDDLAGKIASDTIKAIDKI